LDKRSRRFASLKMANQAKVPKPAERLSITRQTIRIIGIWTISLVMVFWLVLSISASTAQKDAAELVVAVLED